MSTISSPIHGATASRAGKSAHAASASPVGRLSGQRTVAPQASHGALSHLGSPRGTPQAATLSGRKISMLRMITGCAIGATIGALAGGPIGIGVGMVVGSAYVLIGPRAIAQVIQKVALMAYQQIQHYRTSHQPATSV